MLHTGQGLPGSGRFTKSKVLVMIKVDKYSAFFAVRIQFVQTSDVEIIPNPS